MKYRKKPVVIEAFMFAGGSAEPGLPKEWMDRDDIDISPNGDFLIITTLEGNMRAEKGDYIIKGVNGEMYPCKPDIFVKTYEPV